MTPPLATPSTNEAAHSRLAQPPVSSPRAARLRFTLDGDAALENHLTLLCQRIAAGLRGLLPARKIQAVLLGGGYGRGEGGVLRTRDGDKPYNDLEFYVCLKGSRHLNERLFGHALHVFGEILTPQAGVDVEFRITSLRELEKGAVSMFSYDLISGHRWLIGEEALLARSQHHRAAERIPLAEATRLLMNRCAGLLFAADRLQRPVLTAGDVDFIVRNIAKAQLGAGDAVLTAYSQYHWSVRERHQRLQRLVREKRQAWLADVCRHHGEGTEFKLHPHRGSISREELKGLHHHVSDYCRVVWLWLEHRRLGATFRSVRSYVDHKIKCPEARGLRSALVNARALGVRSWRSQPFRHPRERVLTALPLLLWRPHVEGTPDLVREVQRELHTRETTFTGLVSAFRDVWSRVN